MICLWLISPSHGAASAQTRAARLFAGGTEQPRMTCRADSDARWGGRWHSPSLSTYPPHTPWAGLQSPQPPPAAHVLSLLIALSQITVTDKRLMILIMRLRMTRKITMPSESTLTRQQNVWS